MRLPSTAVALSLLTGCASFDYPIPPLEEPEHNTMVLFIYQRDPNMRKDRVGWARINLLTHRDTLPKWVKTCYLSTRNYPREVGHEATHCFSGDFHPENSADEYYKYSLWR